MAAVPLAFQRFAGGNIGSAKPPILILHGVFGSKNNWKSMAKKLASELKRNVFALDARNHGRSPHTPEMSYELMSKDTEEFIERNIGGESSIVIGHSMGGKTAMTLSLTSPHLVERLVVVDVAPVKTPSLTNMMKYMQGLSLIDLKSLKSRSEADLLLQSTIPDTAVRNFLLTNLRKKENDSTSQFHWTFNLSVIKDSMEKYINQFPSDLQYETYSGPTLFVGGSNSSYINPLVFDDIKSLFPNAVIKHIDGAGHWVHSDKPHELFNVLKEFIH